MQQSVESLSKQDNLNTYCASPKLDYCSQYELKMEGSGEDTDPDIIPCHYGKCFNTFDHIKFPFPLPSCKWPISPTKSEIPIMFKNEKL